VTGKMISPQSIAIGAAAVGLVGKESDLFRFTVKHSFAMLLLICIITVLQAYVFTWIIPVYEKIGSVVSATVSKASLGFVYLSAISAIIVLIVLTVFLLNRRRTKTT
jgi:lactate permease